MGIMTKYQPSKGTMTSFNDQFRAEVGRLARKALSDEIASLRKTNATQRRDIAAIKREIADLRRRGSTRPAAPSAPPPQLARFSSKGLVSLMSKLDITVSLMASLFGVSEQTVYNWRNGRRPQPAQLAAIAALRQHTKRSFWNELAARRPDLVAINQK